MKKLLNTLYLTQDNFYLTRERDNIVIKQEGKPIKGIPRHPILGDNVVVYANATVLGRITIGRDCVIGANVWVTRDMRPKSKKYKQTKVDILNTDFDNGGGI